jgi:hypothetical protein
MLSRLSVPPEPQSNNDEIQNNNHTTKSYLSQNNADDFFGRGQLRHKNLPFHQYLGVGWIFNEYLQCIYETLFKLKNVKRYSKTSPDKLVDEVTCNEPDFTLALNEALGTFCRCKH